MRRHSKFEHELAKLFVPAWVAVAVSRNENPVGLLPLNMGRGGITFLDTVLASPCSGINEISTLMVLLSTSLCARLVSLSVYNY